jgi:predicted DNA-binding protein
LDRQQRASRPFMMRLPWSLEARLNTYMTLHGLRNKSSVFRHAVEALLDEEDPERRRRSAR